MTVFFGILKWIKLSSVHDILAEILHVVETLFPVLVKKIEDVHENILLDTCASFDGSCFFFETSFNKNVVQPIQVAKILFHLCTQNLMLGINLVLQRSNQAREGFFFDCS